MNRPHRQSWGRRSSPTHGHLLLQITRESSSNQQAQRTAQHCELSKNTLNQQFCSSRLRGSAVGIKDGSRLSLSDDAKPHSAGLMTKRHLFTKGPVTRGKGVHLNTCTSLRSPKTCGNRQKSLLSPTFIIPQQKNPQLWKGTKFQRKTTECLLFK